MSQLSNAQMKRKADARNDALILRAPLDLIKIKQLAALRSLPALTKQQLRLVQNELKRRGVAIN